MGKYHRGRCSPAPGLLEDLVKEFHIENFTVSFGPVPDHVLFELTTGLCHKCNGPMSIIDAGSDHPGLYCPVCCYMPLEG